MLLNIILVGAGGFIGSVARYLIYLSMKPQNSTFPVGTLTVNVVGCFLIGLLAAYAERSLPARSSLVLFLSTGLLGGFTTFSAFGLETVTMIRDRQLTLAITYVFLSLLLGLSAVFLGKFLSRLPF